MIPATSAEPEQVLTAEQAAELSIASPALHGACRARALFHVRAFREPRRPCSRDAWGIDGAANHDIVSNIRFAKCPARPGLAAACS